MKKQTFLYLGLVFIAWLHHGILWAWLSWNRGISWSDLLNHWDAGHYSALITQGYQGANWAFFPLYPLLVRIWAKLINLLVKPQIAGTLLSIMLFCAWVAIVLWLKRSKLSSIDRENIALLPKTYWGWIFFLYSPSSFIFHSHHTESLFLFLSYLAFIGAIQRQKWTTIIFAGLSALTRNQGYFVIICTALISASYEKNHLAKLKNFIAIGMRSVSIAILFPLYQYWQTGNPFQSIYAQTNWSHATSWLSVLKTFWFGNPWQNTELGSLIHHGVYVLLLIGLIPLWHLSRFLAIYAGLSLAVLPLQGELVNVFRFSAVIFPIWFVLGDQLARIPAWQRIGCLTLLVALNHMVTRNYALAGWAY